MDRNNLQVLRGAVRVADNAVKSGDAARVVAALAMVEACAKVLREQAEKQLQG